MVEEDENGYLRGKLGHSDLISRQLAFKKIYKKNPEKYPLPFKFYVVHHRDRDKHNNGLKNLEIVTPEEHEQIHKLKLEGKKELDEYLTRQNKQEKSAFGQENKKITSNEEPPNNVLPSGGYIGGYTYPYKNSKFIIRTREQKSKDKAKRKAIVQGLNESENTSYNTSKPDNINKPNVIEVATKHFFNKFIILTTIFILFYFLSPVIYTILIYLIIFVISVITYIVIYFLGFAFSFSVENFFRNSSLILLFENIFSNATDIVIPNFFKFVYSAKTMQIACFILVILAFLISFKSGIVKRRMYDREFSS